MHRYRAPLHQPGALDRAQALNRSAVRPRTHDRARAVLGVFRPTAAERVVGSAADRGFAQLERYLPATRDRLRWVALRHLVTLCHRRWVLSP